jgi:hypothetical protein
LRGGNNGVPALFDWRDALRRCIKSLAERLAERLAKLLTVAAHAGTIKPHICSSWLVVQLPHVQHEKPGLSEETGLQTTWRLTG